MEEIEVDALLFVYGTLRRRRGAEGMLRDCVFLREVTVAGVIYDLGEYPALVISPEGWVHGDLWRCSAETLRLLDSYEGVEEGLFKRVRVTAGVDPCWAYVAGPALDPRLATAPVILSGSWSF